MVTDIEIVINPSIIVDCSITLTIVKNHASLENLDYAHSGHTGFASSAQLNDVNNSAVHKTGDERVGGIKTFTSAINFDALMYTNYGEFRFNDHVYFTDNTNAHNAVLEIYANDILAKKTFTCKSALNVDGLIYAGGNELRFNQHLNITDNTDQHNTILHVYKDWINAERIVTLKAGANCDTQPTEAQHVTRKDYVDNLHNSLLRNNLIKSELIPSEFDEVMEFSKQVSGTTFMDQTLATDNGTIVWCAATKAICGDAYYRKFLVNTNGTQAGVTTITPVEGKLYVGKSDNNIFKWSGSNLLEVSKSLGLGETSTTAYAGNKGKANADAIAQLQTDVAGKQETLVSGTNIRTVNGMTILGSGDVTIPGQPLTEIFKVGGNFTSDEITALKKCESYVKIHYGGGSSEGFRFYYPTNNYTGQSKLILNSVTGDSGYYILTINTSDGTWSETFKRISSAIYRHEITVPAQTWYYQNSSTTYITKIIFYSKVQTAITNTDELFNFFRDNDINDGKVCFSDGTHNGCMGLHFYINPAAGYRKIANLQGSNANYWYNAPSTAYSLTDTITVY